MKSKNTKINCIMAGFSLILLGASTVYADETVCRGSLGRVTVDNLRVPDNATCSLTSTRVLGTVKVESNAKLTARKVMVVGNIQGENAYQVNVFEGSRVGGSVQIKQGGGANVSDSFIDGDIQYDENNNPLKVLRNDVGGSVQVVKNFGGAEIRNNVIDGNLQCKENNPAPTGGRNVVGGNKEDQCRRL